ncbi:TPA_asm: penton [Capsaspora MELD virus 2]|nr:TPA_asm: penton [Capsaspora MELD virus 2]
MRFAYPFNKTLDAKTSNKKANIFQLDLTDKMDMRKWKVAFESASIPVSWKNIKAAYGNNTFSYNNGTDDVTVTFPDGLYSISDMNGVLHEIMHGNGDYTTVSGVDVYSISLYLNDVRNRTGVSISSPYTLTIPAGIGQLLGIDAATYDSSFTSQNLPDVDRINSIMILCDFLRNDYHPEPKCLYSFPAYGTSGDILERQVQQLTYIDCNGTDKRSLSIEFQDEDGKALDMEDRNVVVRLIFSDED